MIDGSTTYVYSLDRLARTGGTWELHDALGSVRPMLDAGGTVLRSIIYDLWGQLEAGSAAPFELQQDDLV